MVQLRLHSTLQFDSVYLDSKGTDCNCAFADASADSHRQKAAEFQTAPTIILILATYTLENLPATADAIMVPVCIETRCLVQEAHRQIILEGSFRSIK